MRNARYLILCIFSLASASVAYGEPIFTVDQATADQLDLASVVHALPDSDNGAMRYLLPTALVTQPTALPGEANAAPTLYRRNVGQGNFAFSFILTPMMMPDSTTLAAKLTAHPALQALHWNWLETSCQTGALTLNGVPRLLFQDLKTQPAEGTPPAQLSGPSLLRPMVVTLTTHYPDLLWRSLYFNGAHGSLEITCNAAPSLHHGVPVAAAFIRLVNQ